MNFFKRLFHKKDYKDWIKEDWKQEEYEENIAGTRLYKNQKKIVDKFFLKCTEENKTSVESPTGKYTLYISNVKTKKGCWSFSRGLIISDLFKSSSKSGIVSIGKEIVADIKRNYASFPYLWIKHPNGNEYLVCGEDYQGYTIVNCTKNLIHNYVPKAKLKGVGFCWAGYEFNPELLQLKVEGCYWACPYEIVTYDFSNPDVVPLKELKREDYPYEVEEDENENT